MSKYKKQNNAKSEVGLVALACCDCGLVHKMGFTVDKAGKISLDYERDDRATAQLRRGNFAYLKSGSGKWKMVRAK